MTALEIVRQFADRINDHDIVRMAGLMTPDHRFVDSMGSVITGREAVRNAWGQYFQIVPDYRIEATRFFADAAEVVLLGTARGTYSPDGQLRPADAWQMPAAWRAVVQDDAVAEWQVYADNEPIRRCMARASS